MAYPLRLLAEDEEVVIELHPHWKVLVRPAVVLIVVAGVGAFAMAAIPVGGYRPAARLAVGLLALLVAVVFSVWPWLRWWSTLVVLTTQRLVTRVGVLSRHGRDIPLSRINDVGFRRSLLDRLLGCGTLVVESAGERGRVVLVDIPYAGWVQRELIDRAGYR